MQKKIINEISMVFFLLLLFVPFFVIVPVPDAVPVLVPVPGPVPDQTWSRSLVLVLVPSYFWFRPWSQPRSCLTCLVPSHSGWGCISDATPVCVTFITMVFASMHQAWTKSTVFGPGPGLDMRHYHLYLSGRRLTGCMPDSILHNK